VGFGIGGHGFQAQIQDSGVDPATVTINTTVSGSSLVIFDAGEYINTADPTDNKGNSLTKRGTDQDYAGGLWPGFGSRAYANTGIAGGSSHTVTIDKDNAHATEEISVAVVEVLGGTSIVQSQGSAAAAGAGVGYSSPNITTTGPATIIAFWSGDADVPVNPKDVAVSSPWSILDASFQSGTAYVQFAVAYRTVGSAGTYSLTWTPVANQGASMHMVAVQ